MSCTATSSEPSLWQRTMVAGRRAAEAVLADVAGGRQR
jgi:hypothetical protein